MRGNWEDIRNPGAFRGVAVREKRKDNEFSDANERGSRREREREQGLLGWKGARTATWHLRACGLSEHTCEEVGGTY